MGVQCVCMRAKWMQDYRGVLGHAPPKKFDALRSLLRPFWDSSRAIVATWLAEYCIIIDCPCSYAITNPADRLQISMREGTKLGRTAGGVTSL